MKTKRIIANYDNVIEEIEKHDLWELAPLFPNLNLIKLKTKNERSKGSFMICPFHKEKTPSFYWFFNTMTWHCFGCGLSGNVIGFYMRYKKVNPFLAILGLSKFFEIPIEWKKIHRSLTIFPHYGKAMLEQKNGHNETLYTENDLPF